MLHTTVITVMASASAQAVEPKSRVHHTSAEDPTLSCSSQIKRTREHCSIPVSGFTVNINLQEERDGSRSEALDDHDVLQEVAMAQVGVQQDQGSMIQFGQLLHTDSQDVL